MDQNRKIFSFQLGKIEYHSLKTWKHENVEILRKTEYLEHIPRASIMIYGNMLISSKIIRGTSTLLGKIMNYGNKTTEYEFRSHKWPKMTRKVNCFRLKSWGISNSLKSERNAENHLKILQHSSSKIHFLPCHWWAIFKHKLTEDIYPHFSWKLNPTSPRKSPHQTQPPNRARNLHHLHRGRGCFGLQPA